LVWPSLDLKAQDRDYFLQLQITNQNGLPQNTVRDIAFSTSGYLWLATEDGIARYDGKNTFVYNSQNAPIPSNRICQIIQTTDGHLYGVTDEDDLLEIIEKPPFVSISFKGKLPDKGFLKYHLFQSKNIEEFIRIYNRVNSDFTNHSNQLVMIALQNKSIYVEKNKNGLRLLSPNSENPTTIPIPDCISKRFFTIHDSLFFMGPDRHFHHVNLQNGKITDIKKTGQHKSNLNTSTLNSNDGRIIWNEKTASAFLIEQNSLYEIKREGSNIALNKLIDQLPAFAISEVSFSPDKEQLIIGTLSNGFYLYRKSWFETIHSPFSNNIFYAQISTQQNTIITPKPTQELSLNNQRLLSHNEGSSLFTLYLDTLHNWLWTNSADSLIQIDMIHQKKIGHYGMLDSTEININVIDRCDDSSLYIGTANSLYLFTLHSGFKKLGTFQFNSFKKQSYCFLHDGDSVLWIGTHSGLFKYSHATKQLSKENFPNYIVRTLFRTSSGVLLIGTYGHGIYTQRHQTYVPLPLDRFNNLKTTHSFKEDRLGYIWLSSNNGLYRVNLTDINEFVQDHLLNPIYYYRFSTNDGLPTNEFNGGCYPSSISLPNGMWSFPSMNGLVLFRPEKIKTNAGGSNLFIDKILINDFNVHQIDSVIKLPKHQFKLAMFVSSPNWSDETNLQISYKIDDNEWNVLRQNNAAIMLQNLAGGEHILTIRKRSGFSPDDTKEIRFRIRVPKLLYECWWFWPITILALFLVIAGAIRFSNHAIRRRKEKLESMVHSKTKALKDAVSTLEQQNQTIKQSEDYYRKETELKTTLLFLLSHDIATPLRYVNMHLADCTNPSTPSIDVNDLIDLKISTTNLEYLLDNIVTWVKHSVENNSHPPIVSVHLHDLVAEKLRLFDLMIQRKQNHIQNLISQDTLVPADPFILSMAIQNILGNAVHHTKNGDIRLEYNSSDIAHQIIITDSGIGLNESFSSSTSEENKEGRPLNGYGIGLKIANQLLELINGYIEVKSNDKGKGTIAIINIRKSNS